MALQLGVVQARRTEPVPHRRSQSKVVPHLPRGGRLALNRAELKSYADWLCRRGRERSAQQYVTVIRGYLANEDSYFHKINDKALSPSYRRHLVACLRSWAKYKKDQELIDTLDDLRLPPPAPRDHREPLTLREWNSVRKAVQQAEWIDPFVKNALLVVILRGLRVGDVLRLTLKHARDAIDSGSLAFESKGGGWKHFSSSSLLEPLTALLSVWPSGATCIRDGILIERQRKLPSVSEERRQKAAKDAVRAVLKRITNELQIPLFAHRFRHTYATLFLQEMEGDPEALFKLKDQMGWAQLATAQNYLRRSRREELAQVEATLLNKLDD